MPNRLLKEGIEELSRLSLTELQAIKGIGLVKALQIKAVFEFEKRHKISKNNGKAMKSAKDVYDYVSPKLSGLDVKDPLDLRAFTPLSHECKKSF